MNCFLRLSLVVISSLVATLISCQSNDRKENEIRIEITDQNAFLVDNIAVSDERLHVELMTRRDEIIKANASHEVVVVLTLSKSAKVGAVAKLQEILRKLNIKRIVYVNSEDGKFG